VFYANGKIPSIKLLNIVVMAEFHGNAKNNSSYLARKIATSFFIGQSMASLCISDFFFFMYLHTGTSIDQKHSETFPNL
jgi:hypothetical protein